MPLLSDYVKPYKTGEAEKVVKVRHRYPARIEKIYAKAMRDMVDEINAELKGSIAEAIKADIKTNQDGFRRDALSDILRAIRDTVVGLVSPSSMARRIAQSVIGANDRAMGQAIQRAVGVSVALPPSDMDEQISAWVEENVSYITKMQTDYLTSVQGVVSKGFQSGLSYTDISKQIRERTGITKRRATLIARDQVGSLNAQVTRQRNEELGVESYIWRTVGDERVRGLKGGRYPDANPSHAARDGKEYTWKDGAGARDRHPGDGIQCRCYAESVIKF